MRTILSALCILIYSLSFAQTSAGHKTYSGAFPTGNSDGKATYSYLTTENGERSFDGHFKFTSRSKKMEGNFKNNRQIGNWVLNSAYLNSNVIINANFGENGYLNGRCTIRDIRSSGKVTEIMDAVYRNGRLNGPFSCAYNDGYISGQYRNNEPVGIWKYSWLETPVDFDKKMIKEKSW